MKLTRRKLLAGGALAVTAGGVLLSGILGDGGSPQQPGRSRARKVSGDTDMPGKADVVVIGGGDIGSACAYYLAGKGLSVVLCEKGEIGCEASCRSVGWVYSLGMPPGNVDMASAARPLWQGINAELGIDSGYRPNGLIIEIADEKERAFWVGWLKQNAHLAPAAQILEAREVAGRVKATKPWHGAVYDPTDGCAEPPLVAPAFAEGARKRGAKVLVGCAVRGIESAGGKITAVVTERGRIKTERVVLAGGAWTSLLLKNMGIALPTATIFSWCSSFYGVDGPDGAGAFANTTWRRQIDGGYTTSIQIATAPLTPELIINAPRFRELSHESPWKVDPRLGGYFFERLLADRHWAMDQRSPFEDRRILEPEPNPKLVARMLEGMRSNLPAFKDLRSGEAWGGGITASPDEIPFIGPVPGLAGLVVATAFVNGLAKTPAVGKCVAELVNGESPAVSLHAFRLDRIAA